MKKIKDNPVPSLDNLTIGEFEDIMYSLKESNKHPGLSGKAYSNLIQKLRKLQNGVENVKEKPKFYIMRKVDYEPDSEIFDDDGILLFNNIKSAKEFIKNPIIKNGLVPEKIYWEEDEFYVAVY